jgi:hypothetical protein
MKNKGRPRAYESIAGRTAKRRPRSPDRTAYGAPQDRCVLCGAYLCTLNPFDQCASHSVPSDERLEWDVQVAMSNRLSRDERKVPPVSEMPLMTCSPGPRSLKFHLIVLMVLSVAPLAFPARPLVCLMGVCL